MKKPRSDSFAFNPEKILAVDAQKQADPFVPRIIVLADDFKEHLYGRMETDYSDREAEFAALEKVLRAALKKIPLRMGDRIFGMLLQDLRLGWLRRQFKKKTGDDAPNPG